MGAPAHETRTVHHIGFAVRNRVEQKMILLRIVFEIGVLNNDNVASGGAEAGAQRGPLSLIFRMVKNDIRQAAKTCLQNLSGSICRTIIHQDNFEIWNT